MSASLFWLESLPIGSSSATCFGCKGRVSEIAPRQGAANCPKTEASRGAKQRDTGMVLEFASAGKLG
jgi:hypothetical protein